MEHVPTSESSSSSEGFGENIQQNPAKDSTNYLLTQGPFQWPQVMEMPASSHGNPININDAIRYLSYPRDYPLPVSNLPPEFRLESSSRPSTIPQQLYPHGPIPAGTRGMGIPDKAPLGTNSPTQNPINMPLPPMGPQDQSFQGLLNQAMPPSGHFPSAGLPYPLLPPNIPMQQVMGQHVMGQPYNMGTPSPYQMMEHFTGNPNKGKLAHPTVNLVENLLPQAGGAEGQSYAPESSNARTQAIKNSVYDPKYEQMRLPVDPHLRLFVARRTTGSP